MFWPVALPRKSHYKAAAKMRAANLESDMYRNETLENAQNMSGEQNGDTSANSSKIVVGSDLDISVTYTRVVTATALGLMASKLNGQSLHYVVDPLWNGLISLSGVQRQVNFGRVRKNEVFFYRFPFYHNLGICFSFFYFFSFW